MGTHLGENIEKLRSDCTFSECVLRVGGNPLGPSLECSRRETPGRASALFSCLNNPGDHTQRGRCHSFCCPKSGIRLSWIELSRRSHSWSHHDKNEVKEYSLPF